MQIVHCLLRAFVIYTSLLFFTTELVKKGNEIQLTIKAFCNRVVTLWLSHCLEECPQRHGDEYLQFTYVALTPGRKSTWSKAKETLINRSNTY